MKLFIKSLGCALVLAFASTCVNAEPLAKLKVRSYLDFTNAITRFATLINPSRASEAVQQFNAGLGLSSPVSFEIKKPWEIAIWYEAGASQPVVAVKAPVSDITRFKDSLQPDGALRGGGREWTQLANGLGMIMFRDLDALSSSEKAALNQWKAEVSQPPAQLVELTLSLSEPLRTQVSGIMGIAKMSISQAVTSQNTLAPQGVNPSAFGGLLNAYFEIFDTFLNGFQQARLGLELKTDSLQVDEVITAKPGTELARWLQKPAGQLSAQDFNAIDPEAFMSIAGYLGKDLGFMQIVQKLTVLGFQMQNVATNDPAVKEVCAMIEKMLPVNFTASVYLKDQMAFVGSYRFPSANAAEAYAQIKLMMSHSMQTMVGKDKIYSAITLSEKHHTINGIPIDRVALAINEANPLFNLPGQKEQLRLFFPNGKMEIDYAFKEGQILMASGDRMKELLESSAAKTSRTTAFRSDETRCLAGSLNLLSMIKQMAGFNPMIPGPVKETLARLNPQGSAIEFQISLDQQFHSTARVPLKLFQELGRLRGNPGI